MNCKKKYMTPKIKSKQLKSLFLRNRILDQVNLSNGLLTSNQLAVTGSCCYCCSGSCDPNYN